MPSLLQRIRDIALQEEVKINSPNVNTAVSILGLSSSLSRFVCILLGFGAGILYIILLFRNEIKILC